MAFPQTRMRRLRATHELRGLVRETQLSASDLVYPLFVAEGLDGREPIWTMPGIDRLSMAEAVAEAGSAAELGHPRRDPVRHTRLQGQRGHRRLRRRGNRAAGYRAIKRAHPELLVITDLCLCEYTDHGHCGVLRFDGIVENDKTLELLARTAVSQAQAGADIVAPSDMMDGRIGTIREALDDAGLTERRSWRTPRSSRPRSTGRSAPRPTQPRRSGIAADTSWIRRTAARRFANHCWTSRRGPTC